MDLRLRLHDGKLIKDRRYHLRTYPNCFVAQELIDWLVSHKEALERATAVCLMQHLMDHDIVHHGERGVDPGHFIGGTHVNHISKSRQKLKGESLYIFQTHSVIL